MSDVITFPNIVCLVLTGVLVVHLLSSDPTLGSLTEPRGQRGQDRHLEALYCRLPQSVRAKDERRCPSAQRLFLLLGNGCSLEKTKQDARINIDNVDDGEHELNTTDSSDDFEEAETIVLYDQKVAEESKEPEEEMKSSLVDSFVISLLVCSAIISLLEWYKERARNKEKDVGGDGVALGGGEGASDRRISLAELTVNRHLRRRDSQQLEPIRQSTFANGSRPPLIRRSSFPALLTSEGRVRPLPQRQQSSPVMPVGFGRRLSVDLTEEDTAPDRRRVRILRRH